ncbi:hypothetical protein MPSEU_000339000 [Mayamaea pseudoterrestris]|nr:hypothetical protein MPSEU_000339000 [Mayamaea pseudoterrestris]
MKCRPYESVLWGLLLLLPTCCSTFTPSIMSSSTHRMNRKNLNHRHYQPVALQRKHIKLFSSADFDFSSSWAWEQYYARNESVVTDWHGSVPLQDIALLVSEQLDAQQMQQQEEGKEEDAEKDTETFNPTCLIIGCGTSDLPTVLRAFLPKLRMILLDSSATCMIMLRERYQHDSLVTCICEDATRLDSIADDSIDLIIDKGFLDALLCSEGWNGLVERTMAAATRVLKRGSGKYVWIGYKLPQSTLDFMAETTALDMHWENDCDGSNDNVAIRIGVRKR